ncbi:restriction endonuclease [Streptomyces sp. NPDC005202]|uniref:restriction endonuclease n=1 Tax=Streptomyces sp. NPDC005202 TaxID=3157021 RepID=UPI0033B2DCF6
MGTSFVDPSFLGSVGPSGFTRQLERLALHLGFSDVANIDGSYDQGGDLPATRNGRRWVFQAKWKLTGLASPSALDEVIRAKAYYNADHAVVVTNTHFGPWARKRQKELSAAGIRVELWGGSELSDLYAGYTSQRLPARELRPYQLAAFEGVIGDLEGTGRSLLILATGLGKTVVGGEVISRFFMRKPDARVLVVAPTKELVEQLERSLWHHVPKSVRTRC